MASNTRKAPNASELAVYSGFLERNRHMALGSQVVNLIRLHLLDNAYQTAGVRHVTIVQDKITIVNVGILIQVVDAVSIEQRSAAFNAMDNVALLQQKLCQVSAILSGHSGNQCNFTHKTTFKINVNA